MTIPNVMQRDAAARQSPDGVVLPLPSPLLAMMPPALQELPMQFFYEPVRMAAVAPLGSQTQQFTTDQTHVFVGFWGSLKVRSSDNQTDRDADPAAILMTDTQNLQYQPPGVLVDVAGLFGNAKQPAIWPVPLIVKQNSGVIVTVTNQSNANTNNYNFLFVGVLIKVPSSLVF